MILNDSGTIAPGSAGLKTPGVRPVNAAGTLTHHATTVSLTGTSNQMSLHQYKQRVGGQYRGPS